MEHRDSHVLSQSHTFIIIEAYNGSTGCCSKQDQFSVGICMLDFLTCICVLGCSVFSTSACVSLDPPIGGPGGGAFSDPCDSNTRIVSMEIGTGEFDGIKDCFRYIKTTYRYS